MSSENPEDDASFAGEATSQPPLEHSLELVHRVQAGDDDALNELFQRYEARVRRIARIRMGARVRTFMDSCDLVQGTYAVAMQKIQSFRTERHAGIIQWLAKILENQIRDAADYTNAAKRSPDRAVRLDAGDSTASVNFELTAREPDPHQAAADAELREIYDACVEQLPEAHREVVLLRDYAGGSWDYIAKELGSPSAHAALELHRRARVKLASLVGRHIRSDDAS